MEGITLSSPAVLLLSLDQSEPAVVIHILRLFQLLCCCSDRFETYFAVFTSPAALLLPVINLSQLLLL
jgi:hypothetical protein